MKQIFMRMLDNPDLPDHEPFWYFDLFTIWMLRNFGFEPREEVLNTFNDSLEIREGSTDKLFNLVWNLSEDEMPIIEEINKKYPIKGICCVKWDMNKDETVVRVYFSKCSQRYMIIFEGEILGECFDDMEYQNDVIAKPVKLLKIYDRTQIETEK